MRIAFTTLGCKINQYETDLLRQDVLSKGNTVVPFDSEADVYVINTCSVTAKSDYQCRQVIRSVVRRAGGAKVVVTGCYASVRPDEIKSISGVDLVVDNKDKRSISARIMPETPLSGPGAAESGPLSLKPVRERTRAFLKIQDGCNNRCSYCIVPSARGESRSVPQDGVIKEFERLVSENCPEIVLTGIHIGTYGSDLVPPVALSSLLKNLISNRGASRIRLSSIEANEVTPEIVSFLGSGLCRHLHIPLQSGDDSILSSMKRHYTSGFYRELLMGIASSVPGVALGADVIVGFPGEGEREFEKTVELVEQSSLTHLHVFSYSPRPGTPAARMNDQIPDRVKKERNEMLRKIGLRKNLEFRKRFLGKELDVVVEESRSRESNLLTGLTDNYIRVAISGAKEAHIGTRISAKLESASETESTASIL